MARKMVDSKRRPLSIKRAQKKAWGQVKKARAMFLKESQRFDKAMAIATRMMRDSAEWEREDRKLREDMISLCERVRNAAAVKEMEAVRKIRRQMTNQFQENVTRVPILRRVLSRSRSRPPTQIGNSGSESAS